VGEIPLLRSEAHTAEQLAKSWFVVQYIGQQWKAQRVQSALFDGIFQPGERQVPVAEAEVDDRETLRRDVLPVGALLELRENI
jgi:hypothetical protein